MCLLYSHLKRVILTWRNTSWRSSHAFASSTLWWISTLLLPVGSLTNCPFMKNSGRNSSEPLPSCTDARKHWIFEVTSGCVLCRHHLTGLKWSQEWYKSRHCLSKPGNNQPNHPPQGLSWKSLVQNNVLLLQLVWKNNKSYNTYENYHNDLRGSQLNYVFRAHCRGL